MRAAAATEKEGATRLSLTPTTNIAHQLPAAGQSETPLAR
jgi:hypothetical protein